MNKLIFVVEDHPVQQKMLKVHFEESLGNYTVKTFANPAEIFDHLKEKPFAIVLDHFFGDSKKTGLDYLKELKKTHSAIPVIYYTTLNDDAIRSQVLKLKAEQYIIKDSASLVRLRTALDQIEQRLSKKNFLQRLFS